MAWMCAQCAYCNGAFVSVCVDAGVRRRLVWRGIRLLCCDHPVSWLLAPFISQTKCRQHYTALTELSRVLCAAAGASG